MSNSTHSLIPYAAAMRSDWDRIVERARNGHFIFQRGYMEYHADRFPDCSYLLLRRRKPVALLPAHRLNGDLISHKGLSFGGWILAPECLYGDLEAGFQMLAEDMAKRGLARLVYSPSPSPYHRGPCGDDLFILQKNGARCHSPRLGAFLRHADGLPQTWGLRRRLRRGEENLSCAFEETENLDRFWDQQDRFHKKTFGASPVHSAEEMRLLKSRFPSCIRLIIGRRGSDWLAGRVLFLSRQVLRFQYVFWDTDFPQAVLTDRMTKWILQQPDYVRSWVDFGTSNDPQSGELTKSLHLHKEVLGARGLPLSTWIWKP
jgi:hypothetical protein